MKKWTTVSLIGLILALYYLGSTTNLVNSIAYRSFEFTVITVVIVFIVYMFKKPPEDYWKNMKVSSVMLRDK